MTTVSRETFSAATAGDGSRRHDAIVRLEQAVSAYREVSDD